MLVEPSMKHASDFDGSQSRVTTAPPLHLRHELLPVILPELVDQALSIATAARDNIRMRFHTLVPDMRAQRGVGAVAAPGAKDGRGLRFQVWALLKPFKEEVLTIRSCERATTECGANFGPNARQNEEQIPAMLKLNRPKEVALQKSGQP